ncbi:Rft protein-domain-containing protein [Aspergillus cavernicola]|uniref:Man(5)GlcNAc(2)-PP-dolichol translocation protein RFT1 n=1 Tax=Aspergillus cavernicola TaxID=176166 RepID=A0ABR4J2C8_9EURO
MSQPAGNASTTLASAMSGTTLLIFVQLASRLFIFVSNQMILRSLSPSILGVSAQLELFLISILYFSRESIRAAIQRQPLQPFSASPVNPDKNAVLSNEEEERRNAQAKSSQLIVNMTYLSIGMGVVTSMAFALFYVHFASKEVSETPFYHASVAVTAIASLIELSSEPSFAVVQQYMLYSKRAAVEIGAAFIKSLVVCGICAWAAWTGHSLGVLPFALGYLSYSLMLFCGYSLVATHQSSDWQFSLLLSRIRPSDKATYFADRFSWLLMSLSANVFFQSVMKHLLTQGDSMILAAMTSLEDQGIYSLASNYGGLLARILFQPIEESSRTIFSSLLSSRGAKNRESNIETAKVHLLNVVRGYMMISVVIIPLGPALAPKALHILGGRRWTTSEADSLLALYCYYIPFLAFNGISEAFVSSTASPAELRKQAAWMGLFSACFALAAYVFLAIGDMGARGLVYANIVNMSIRIVWSFSFVREYFRQHKSNLALDEFALRPRTYAAGAIATVILSDVESRISSYRDLISFTVGGLYILLVLYFEKEPIMTHSNRIYQYLRSKGTRSKIRVD